MQAGSPPGDGGAIILDGDRLRDRIVADVGAAVRREFSTDEVVLAIVLAAHDPSSRTYVESKCEWARAAGISARLVEAHEPTTTEIRAAVEGLASDASVHGLLVQMPLPEGVDTAEILDSLPMKKDVDGLSSSSCWQVLSGMPAHVPCTPLAITRFIDHYGIETRGRRAVAVAPSFGAAAIPMALLASRHSRVTFVTPDDAELAEICRSAEILVSAVNRPEILTRAHVRPGAAVFDLGIDGTAAGLPGDVRFDEVRDIAGWITPVPGGMGAMTIACLLENTLAAARSQPAPL